MSDVNQSRLVKQQKYRATRVDPNYPSKPNALRRLMWILTLAVPLAGAALLMVLTFNPFTHSGRIVYEPGPVSAQHSFFNHRCEDCHEGAAGKFGVVSNSKCRVCHDGPLHNVNQVCPNGEKLIKHERFSLAGRGKDLAENTVTYDEPRCATCHTEHKGNQKLVQMSDNHCTQCHADLKLKNGAALTVAKSIVNFAPSGGHEEWRILRADPAALANFGGNDPTQLRFNHSVHMGVSYDPSSKFGVRKMQCGDCHKATETNLDTMPDDSARLTAFERFLTPPELDSFYDALISAAAADKVFGMRLNRVDVRKLAVEALGTRDLSDRFDRVRSANWRDPLSDAIVSLIRARALKGPTAAALPEADSDELKRFEALIPPSVLNDFYDTLARATVENHLVGKKLERAEIRQFATAALADRELGNRLLALTDKRAFKDDVSAAILKLQRERLTNTPAHGQTRYMIPVTYERNCATECHWHKLPAIKLSDNTDFTPPHGQAAEARRVLRAAIFADAVRQALTPRTLSDEDKATRVLVKRVREELAKKAGAPALEGKDTAAANVLLIKTLNDDTATEPYAFVTRLFSPDESIALMGGILDPIVMKRYATMKEDKRDTLNERIGNRLEALISAYAEDSPASLTTVNATTDRKLADASRKLFAPMEDVRARKEKGACLFCHEPTAKPSSRPENSDVVADVHMPARWLNHSVFNHETHRVIDCESCHDRARGSVATSDVLLPGIQKCQECHKPAGARTDCIECHLFHDKSHETRDRFVSTDDLMKLGASGVKVREAENGAQTPEVESANPGGPSPTAPLNGSAK